MRVRHELELTVLCIDQMSTVHKHWRYIFHPRCEAILSTAPLPRDNLLERVLPRDTAALRSGNGRRQAPLIDRERRYLKVAGVQGSLCLHASCMRTTVYLLCILLSEGLNFRDSLASSV